MAKRLAINKDYLSRLFQLRTINLSKKILVTGGTGFLGAYIIKELVGKGYRVRALRRSPQLPFFISPAILQEAEWVQGDVLDVMSLEDAMEGVDAVIHAAGFVSFIRREREEMYRVNTEGTANVVNMALEKNVQRLVHISSVAALGRTAGGGQVDEEKKWEDSKVNTHYGKSKYKAELEVWRGMAEGLEAVILNPSTILGYGDWRNGSCAIFKNIYEGFNWYPPGINGFVDVEDVAKLALLFLENHITEQRLIVNADTWTFKSLMDEIAENFGKKKPSRASTPLLLNLAWRLENWKCLFTGSRPLLTKESARIAISKTYFSNEKLLAALPGFSFTPLEQTIRAACAKYREQVS
jgi:nucleoside-diphosphate-sugar epimerase